MLVLFQHHGTGTVRQHKAVAITIPRATGSLRIIIAGSHCSSRTETTQAQTTGCHFRTARHHHVGFAIGDVARRHADAMRTCGARSGHCVIRALQTILNGQVPGHHIDDRPRHKEWGNTARTTIEQLLTVLFDIG